MRLETKKQKAKRMRNKKVRAILGFIAIAGVIIVLAIIFLESKRITTAKNKEYDRTIQELQAEIKTQQLRSEELVKKREYTTTREYIEGIAKNKLGLVYPNEIVFHAEDK